MQLGLSWLQIGAASQAETRSQLTDAIMHQWTPAVPHARQYVLLYWIQAVLSQD